MTVVSINPAFNALVILADVSGLPSTTSTDGLPDTRVKANAALFADCSSPGKLSSARYRCRPELLASPCSNTLLSPRSTRTVCEPISTLSSYRRISPVPENVLRNLASTVKASPRYNFPGKDNESIAASRSVLLGFSNTSTVIPRFLSSRPVSSILPMFSSPSLISTIRGSPLPNIPEAN